MTRDEARETVLNGWVKDADIRKVLTHILDSLDALDGRLDRTPLVDGDVVRWWQPGHREHGEVRKVVSVGFDIHGKWCCRIDGYEEYDWLRCEVTWRGPEACAWLVADEWQRREEERLAARQAPWSPLPEEDDIPF